MLKKEALAIIWILLYPNLICMQNDVWKPVTVSNASLNNSTMTTRTFGAAMDVVCAMIASRFPWANLFCFNPGGTCLISSFIAMPYKSQAAIPFPVDCMTKLDGCIYKGSRIDIGTKDFTAYPQCPTCISGQMVPVSLLPPSGTCDPPFYKVGNYGCFTFGNVTKEYCSSRAFCQSLGGDLWYLKANQNATFLAAAANAIGIGTKGLLLGVYGNGTDFYWLDGALINKSSSMFLSPIPPTSTTNQDGNCARISVDGTFKLVPLTCSSTTDVLCQKRTLQEP